MSESGGRAAFGRHRGVRVLLALWFTLGRRITAHIDVTRRNRHLTRRRTL
jgi:hypothetical protein